MRTRAALVIALALAAAAPARAAEQIVIQHQGRLLDADDNPINGPVTIVVRLYSKSDGSSSDIVWFDTWQLTPKDGLYSIALGDTRDEHKELTPAAVDGDRWMGLVVQGVEMTPRLKLGTVAKALDAAALGGVAADQYALKNAISTNALQLGGIDADQYALKTSTVANAQKLGGVDAADYALESDTVANALELGGELPSHYALSAHDHAGVYATPGHDHAGLYSAAAHDHDAAYSGLSHNHDAAYEKLTGSTDLTLSGLGSFGLLGLTPFSGSQTSCTGSLSGRVYFDQASRTFFGCDGDNWVALVANRGLGVAKSNPGASCADIKTRAPRSDDGVYWIDPDGAGAGEAAFQAYCDMTNDAGGWTLCFSYDNSYYDAWNWPTVTESRNKMLARKWGGTMLFGDGTRQGNFCNLFTVAPNTTKLRGEVVTVGESKQFTSGIFTLKKANFFTQVHNNSTRAFDCLIDSNNQRRLMYANYFSPVASYNQYYLSACSGVANDHLDKTAANIGSGIDGLLIIAGDASGVDHTNEATLHVNWSSSTCGTASCLYTDPNPVTQTKFGVSVNYFSNAYGRQGATPGLNYCTTACGYTNQVNNVLKTRLWIK